EYGGVSFTVLKAEAASEGHTLKLAGKRRGKELVLEFQYDTGKLEHAVVERWSRQFQTLFGAALVDPEIRVSRLPLVNEEERRRLLVDWNRTEAEYPRESSVHELFEAQVERTPE